MNIVSNENQKNIIRNLRNLRIYLDFTQKEFIKYFLSTNQNKIISLATFSNLENKGGKMLMKVIEKICDRLNISPIIFSLEDEKFIETIKHEYKISKQLIKNENNLSSEFTEIINILSKYFTDMIIEGKLKKGDKIESDRILAEKLKIGRSSIREALKSLQLLGMIEILPGKGSFISREESNFLSLPLSWSLYINGNQIRELLFLRLSLEELSSFLAAENATESEISDLKAIQRELRIVSKKDNLKEFIELDRRFHRLLAESSDSELLKSQILTIQNILKKAGVVVGMDNQFEMEKLCAEHDLILEAIENRDSKLARYAMRAHMDKAFERYKL